MNNLVIIPTYNEKENVPLIIERVLKNADCDILFIDDNSPDKTGELIKGFMKNEKRINIIERCGKLGLGTAYVEGFKYALKSSYKKVFMMDSDLSHPPEKIKNMIESNVDFVIGSRYVLGGNIIGWPWYRHVLSRTANTFAHFVLNTPYNEHTGGFNCIKREVLEKIDISSLKCEGYAFIIEIKYKAFKNGFRFLEIPITFVERAQGYSKISKKIILEALWLVLKLKFTKIGGKK